MNNIEPVDAVITWVNGYDQNHRNKLNAYLTNVGQSYSGSIEPTRYNQQGEISYCLASLLRYAPWLRTIYVVTDDQTPPAIAQLTGNVGVEKIKIIDHKEIFAGFETHLPTFNSLTIESVLWRIKGLSDNFIYLNDDCALIRPVSYEDFFRDNKPVLRGNWKIHKEKKMFHYISRFMPFKQSNLHRTVQENAAKLLGSNKYFFHLPHAPFSLRKKTLERFFAQYPDYLIKNISYPLRDNQQFWSISLAHHLEIKEQIAPIDNSLATIMINGALHSEKKIKKRLSKADKQNNIAFICLQSLDLASESMRKLMLNWMDNKIFLRTEHV